MESELHQKLIEVEERSIRAETFFTSELMMAKSLINDLQDKVNNQRLHIKKADTVIDMFRQAYAVDAVAEWFDINNNGGKSIISSYDEFRLDCDAHERQ